MCTVSVKVNEDVLRDYLPELENTAAVRKWAQMLIDQRIQEICRERALDRDMTPEELYDIVAEEIDSIYALGLHELYHQASGIA